MAALTYMIINLLLSLLYGGLGIVLSIYSIGKNRNTIALNLILIIGDLLIIIGSFLNFFDEGVSLYFIIGGLILVQATWIICDYILDKSIDLRHQVVALIIGVTLIITYFKTLD